MSAMLSVTAVSSVILMIAVLQVTFVAEVVLTIGIRLPPVRAGPVGTVAL
ncbi:hypothetical protein ACI3KS_01940 [Microbacterium sp. ZW T5_45]